MYTTITRANAAEQYRADYRMAWLGIQSLVPHIQRGKPIPKIDKIIGKPPWEQGKTTVPKREDVLEDQLWL